jgi:hypothetical protein
MSIIQRFVSCIMAGENTLAQEIRNEILRQNDGGGVGRKGNDGTHQRTVRRGVLRNMLKHYCGVTLSDSATEEEIARHTDALIAWGKKESIAKNTRHIFDRLTAAGYALTLNDKARIHAHIQQVYDDPQHYNHKNFYALPLEGGGTVGDVPDADIPGISPAVRSAIEAETVRDNFFQEKTNDTILETLQNCFFQEMCLHQDYGLMSTTGEEILYRGMPVKNKWRVYRAEDLKAGKTSRSYGSLFNTSIQAPWSRHGNHSNGTSTSLFLPLALHYAFPKERGKFSDGKNADNKVTDAKKAEKTHNYSRPARYLRKVFRRDFPQREGMLLVIAPPKGKPVLSLAPYNAFGSMFREVVLPDFASSETKAFVTVRQISAREYRVERYEKNPCYHAYHDNEETTAEGRPKRRRGLSAGEADRAGGEESTILENHEDFLETILFKPGTTFKSRSSLWQSLKNNVLYPVYNWVGDVTHFGFSKKIQKTYDVKAVDGKEYTYTAGEQVGIYERAYTNQEHTSKTNPRWKNERAFKKGYTPEKQLEHRRKHNLEYTNVQMLLARETTVWPYVYYVLEQAGLEGRFMEVKGRIQHFGFEHLSFHRHESDEAREIYVTLHRNQLAQLLWSIPEASMLTDEKKKLVDLLIPPVVHETVRDILLERVHRHNQDMNLERGVYGGLGATGSLAYDERGNVCGLRIDAVFDGGMLHRMRMSVGTIITDVTDARGVSHNIARENLSLDAVIAMFRGEPAQTVTFSYIDPADNKETVTRARAVLDATTRSIYNPHSPLIPKGKSQLRQEVYQELLHQNVDIHKVISNKMHGLSAKEGMGEDSLGAAKAILRERMAQKVAEQENAGRHRDA